jgi:hypothetical protein
MYMDLYVFFILCVFALHENKEGNERKGEQEVTRRNAFVTKQKGNEEQSKSLKL